MFLLHILILIVHPNVNDPWPRSRTTSCSIYLWCSLYLSLKIDYSSRIIYPVMTASLPKIILRIPDISDECCWYFFHTKIIQASILGVRSIHTDIDLAWQNINTEVTRPLVKLKLQFSGPTRYLSHEFGMWVFRVCILMFILVD